MTHATVAVFHQQFTTLKPINLSVKNTNKGENEPNKKLTFFAM
jgi:hypothetical protein